MSTPADVGTSLHTVFAFICLKRAVALPQISERPNKEQRKELKENQLAKMARKPKETSWFVLQTFQVIIIFYTGLILNQSAKLPGINLPGKANQVGILFAIFGLSLIGFASGLIARMLLSMCQKGRETLLYLHHGWVHNFIMVIIIVISALYIPIVSIILTMWSCEPHTCNAGKRFITKLSLMEQIHKFSGDAVDTTSKCLKNCCEPCAFLSECPVMHQLCPLVTDMRLRVDESLSCPQHIDWYFGVAAGMISTCFVFGVPVMYFLIIEGHCMMFSKVKCEGDTPEEKWLKTMSNTDNSAKSLYEMFECDWRYYKLIQNLQKLILVVATVSLYTYASAACGLTSVTHGTFFFASIYSQPYIATATDLMGTLCLFCDLGTSFIGILQVMKPKGDSDIPPIVWPLVGALNVILPVAAGTAGAVYAYQQYAIRSEGEAQRDAMLELGVDKEKRMVASGATKADEFKAHVPVTKKSRGRDRVFEVRAERNPVTGEKPHLIFLKITQNRRKDVENFFMEEGVDPNICEGFENCPLHYAVLEGHKSIVKTILRFGADVNIQNKAGNTPLHCAYAYKRDAIIDYLVEKGANTAVRNNAGQDCYEVEGEKLPEFAAQDPAPKKEKKWEPPKSEKKQKATVGGGEKKEKKDERTDKQKEQDKNKEAEADAEIEKQNAKNDLHFRIAQQRKQEANDKINHWVKQATMADPEVRATVDRKVNEYTIKIMTRFFLVMGAMAFVAFGVCLVGLLYSNQDLIITKPVRALSAEEWKMFEFLDYGSWPGFVTHCCCKERPKDRNVTAAHVGADDRVELWMCDNGFRKERLRETTMPDPQTGFPRFFNGSKLRPFCGRSYPLGYCPATYNVEKGRFKVRMCNSSLVTQTFPDLVEFDVMSTRLW